MKGFKNLLRKQKGTNICFHILIMLLKIDQIQNKSQIVKILFLPRALLIFFQSLSSNANIDNIKNTRRKKKQQLKPNLHITRKNI